MDVRVGLWRRLRAKELMLLNCGVEKTLESPLDCKEIKLVNLKGDQPWIFIGRTGAKVGVPILWPLDAKNWLIGKDPDVRKDWRQKEKRMTEDEMVRWHHWMQWTWIWANSGRWWGTVKPGMLQTKGSQRVRHALVTTTMTCGPNFKTTLIKS